MRRRHGGGLRCIATLGATCALTMPAVSQQVTSCPEGRIAGILIDNRSVFDPGDPALVGRFGWAYELANDLHVRTRSEVIERELLFEVGDCYDVEDLRDTERLLRAFSFIADTSIFGILQADGDVHVVVDTQDEWSTRVEPRFASGGLVSLRGVRLVEENLLGSGRNLALYYDRVEEERIFGVSYGTPQLFRSRWNMALGVAQTEVGYSYGEAITYPFVGETGRVAFSHAASRDERFLELRMRDPDDRLVRVRVPVERELLEIAGAFRWGAQPLERYRHTLLGVGLAAERISYPGDPTFADSENNAFADLSALPSAWHPVSSVRLMLLTGQSNAYYVRRRGVATLDGTEDIRLGAEVEVSLGPTLPGLSEDRDVAVGLGLFVASEITPSVLAGARFGLEGRRAYEALPGLPEWNDVLAGLDAWAFLRTDQDSRHSFVAGLSAVGGWHSRGPFQLTLGGESGLRGYPRHVDPGGQRVVASLEHRATLDWPVPAMFDFGTVAFVDAGKIWAGNVPFGIESPVRVSAGVGIRAAFPPGSHQTFRLDVGVPIGGGTNIGDFAVTIGIGPGFGGQAAATDRQLRRSARYVLRTSRFQ